MRRKRVEAHPRWDALERFGLAHSSVGEHYLDTVGVSSSNLLGPISQFAPDMKAHSSVGEHYLDTVGVSSSNLLGPIDEPPEMGVFVYLRHAKRRVVLTCKTCGFVYIGAVCRPFGGGSRAFARQFR